MLIEQDVSLVKQWRSIITLVIFLLTNIIVLIPFNLPILIPRILTDATFKILTACRVVSQTPQIPSHDNTSDGKVGRYFRKYILPLNYVTVPLIAVVFLLTTSAIEPKDVRLGIVGSNHILPYDVVLFSITSAYNSLSIDASGLIRYLAFQVIYRSGRRGRLLFLLHYCLFFIFAVISGNDLVLDLGPKLVAYSLRASSNIKHPRAWVYTQFAIANIGSTILVSSSLTNVILATAFKVNFIHYTANVVVPVAVGAVLLFPFLLYLVFPSESLVPRSIEPHELPQGLVEARPVDPNIPYGRGMTDEDHEESEFTQRIALEEIMNPFLAKFSALFDSILVIASISVILGLSASGLQFPVFWVTLPTAALMMCHDVLAGWGNRHMTRELARGGRQDYELKKKLGKASTGKAGITTASDAESLEQQPPRSTLIVSSLTRSGEAPDRRRATLPRTVPHQITAWIPASECAGVLNGDQPGALARAVLVLQHVGKVTVLLGPETDNSTNSNTSRSQSSGTSIGSQQHQARTASPHPKDSGKSTFISLLSDFGAWLRETFPTVTAVLSHLPILLRSAPFPLTIFILVQALVTKGWVAVFAHGWDHWVHKTGTVGAIAGMSFLSAVLSTLAGTNVGATIFLSRLLQAWILIRQHGNAPISERTLWAAVYSLALGANYAAFGLSAKASITGIQWEKVLLEKGVLVRRLEFIRVNLPIIAFVMVTSCLVLVGQAYIAWEDKPFESHLGLV